METDQDSPTPTLQACSHNERIHDETTNDDVATSQNKIQYSS